MNKLFFSAIIFSFSFLPVLQAETVNAVSAIDAVTVYSDRAQITRTAKVELKPGQQEVIFDGLPGTLEPQSITASGRGKIKVKLFGAAIKTEQLAETQSEARKALQAQYEKLLDDRRGLENTKQVLDQKQQFLASIRAASLDQIGKDLITKSPAVSDVKGIADYLETELASYYQKAAETDFKLRELDKEINRVQRELQQMGGWDPKQKTRVAVDLEAESAGTFEIELRYRVPGASWLPFYEARARVNDEKVFWQQYANVRQNTGEDWKNVTILLSTAQPSLSGQMPETQPWFVRKYEPPVLYKQKRMNAPMSSGLLGGKDKNMEQENLAMGGMVDTVASALEAPPVDASYAVATVDSQGASVEYKIAKQETILSDNQPAKVSVQALELPAAFRYQISPRLSTYAYLTAKVTNPTDGIFLPGEVHLFQENSFIGLSAVRLIGPEEKFDLNMGVDERIKVDRKVLQAKTDISLLPGANGKWKTTDYAYVTKIENYHPNTVDISVVDQVPVSQHTDIKVEKPDFNPKWSEEEKDKPGVYKWHFQLASKAKKEIKLSYRVKYPESFQIDGI